MRISVTGPLSALGWAPGTRLTLEVDAHRGTAVLVPFDAGRQRAAQQLLLIDPSHRVALPACLRAALGLRKGDQVLAVAEPAEERLLILSATRALAAITNRDEQDAPVAAAAFVIAGGPRPRWRPLVPAVQEEGARHGVHQLRLTNHEGDTR